MTSKNTSEKPWGGRFIRATEHSVEKFTESVSFDHRLYAFDIMGSIAHTKMLASVGVIEDSEASTIIKGLESIARDIESGQFEWKTALEDVHMNIESALVKRVGEVGKKLHTGRSRNDQVATDLRLYLREEVDLLRDTLHTLMSVLCDLAESEADTIMPGFTHLQVAQPVTFGHHLMAWFEMLKRDDERLVDCRKRINCMPLGAAALAGTGYPLNREYTAELLGFDAVAGNSMDAVSDRDFVVEFCAAASIIMMHLSRFSEELILWINPMFGFIDIDDAYCTGSSIMPQKKNPDIPELVRGKTARVYGDLMGMLTLMKAQPLAYNRDNQEDKIALFDVVDTLHACIGIYAEMVPAISVNADAMLSAAKEGYATATDLADYLVKAGMAFRDAHEAVGKTVSYAVENKKELSDLTLDELGQFCPDLDEGIYEHLELTGSINARNITGGTAPAQVRNAIASGREFLKK